MRTLKYIYTFSLALVVLFGCTEDEDLSFVDNIVAPSEVTANFSITQDNSGVVTITPNAVGATNYNINYGDGSEEIVNVAQGESTTHTYVEGSYAVTIEAIGLTGLKTEVTENLIVSFTSLFIT